MLYITLFLNLYYSTLSVVHTRGMSMSISTRSIRKQGMTSPLGLAKKKQQEFFFVSPFVLLLAYAWTMILCLCSYAYDDPYVAGLTSFLCFAFCCALCLWCEPGFNILALLKF